MDLAFFSSRRAFALSAALLLGPFGCGDDAGGGAGGGGPDGSTGPFTVTGTVLDQRSGEPCVAATVVLNGQSTATNVSGQFTVTNVAAPYDVAIFAGEGIRAYRGLTIADPTLLAANLTPPPNLAYLSGSVALAGTTTEDQLVCVLDGPRQLDGASLDVSTGTSPIAWSMNFYAGLTRRPAWYGASAIDGTLHCIIERISAELSLAAYHGSSPITLANNGTFALATTPSVTQTTFATVSGDVVAPASFTEVSLAIGTLFAQSAKYTRSVQTPPGAFSRAIPYLSGTSTIVSAWAPNPWGGALTAVVVPATETVVQDLVILDEPTITAPAAASTLAVSDPITWTGSGHVFRVSVSSAVGLVEVITTGETATLPDIAPFAQSYAAGAATITIVEYGPATTVDELVQGTALFDILRGRATRQEAHGPLVSFTLAN